MIDSFQDSKAGYKIENQFLMQGLLMLKPGSSPVDWCEANYSHSPFIAEFANTVSNILFFALPPVLIHLFGPYGRCFNRGIHIIWIMLFIVGVCSAYFHATLSLLGQLLDELAILWVIATGFALWFPHRFLPPFFQKNRPAFQACVLGIATFGSCLALVQPAFNAFALMSLAIPAGILMATELQSCRDSRVLRLGSRCGIIWISAITCWINDKLFCETWSALHFPYLHAVWHVLIFIAAYTGCVLFAYFDAKNRVPEEMSENFEVTLKYWPDSILRSKFEFLGIPYVGIKSLSLGELGVDSFKQHLI